MADQAKPILIGEKTAQQIRESEILRSQAEAMYLQAQARINAILIAVREARNLPDTWQMSTLPDGKLYLVEQAGPQGEPAAEPAATADTEAA